MGCGLRWWSRPCDCLPWLGKAALPALHTTISSSLLASLSLSSRSCGGEEGGAQRSQAPAGAVAAVSLAAASLGERGVQGAQLGPEASLPETRPEASLVQLARAFSSCARLWALLASVGMGLHRRGVRAQRDWCA